MKQALRPVYLSAASRSRVARDLINPNSYIRYIVIITCSRVRISRSSRKTPLRTSGRSPFRRDYTRIYSYPISGMSSSSSSRKFVNSLTDLSSWKAFLTRKLATLIRFAGSWIMSRRIFSNYDQLSDVICLLLYCRRASSRK